MSGMAGLKVAAVVVGSFSACTAGILVLLAKSYVSGALAGLMFVALIGLYIGFGILIAVYRLISKLE